MTLGRVVLKRGQEVPLTRMIQGVTGKGSKI